MRKLLQITQDLFGKYMKAYNKDKFKRRKQAKLQCGDHSKHSQQYRPLNTHGNRRREHALKVSERQAAKRDILNQLLH